MKPVSILIARASIIDVSVALDEGFPKLYVDSSLMRRMYTNLINNAVQVCRTVAY